MCTQRVTSSSIAASLGLQNSFGFPFAISCAVVSILLPNAFMNYKRISDRTGLDDTTFGEQTHITHIKVSGNDEHSTSIGDGSTPDALVGRWQHTLLLNRVTVVDSV